jgi:tetratricopeptide (TPR) repeat protein
MNPENRHDWKIDRLEQRCDNQEQSPDVMLDLAEAYFQKGYYYGDDEGCFRKGMGLAESVVDQFGGSARAFNLLANAAYGLGDLEIAETFYKQALSQEPDDSLAHVGLGNLHKQRGNHSRAVDAFTRATVLDPDLWQAHYNLGGALFFKARGRDFKGSDELMAQAIYHLVTALRLKPFETFLGNIYRDLGELFLHTRQYNYARRFFNRLLQHPEHGTTAHYYLGLTQFSMGRYPSSIHHFREFLKEQPDSALCHSKIGLAYLEQGDWARARESCHRALVIDENTLLARFSLGCIDLDERLYDSAAECFESILAREVDYFPAYVELVKTHYVQADFSWLFDQLRSEIAAFEAHSSFDGGRQYYKGARGRCRRRIDVLLAQIQEMGVDAFATLAEIVETVSTDSLRFQMWEQLYELSRQHRVNSLLDQLEEPGRSFGRKLGRTLLLLSRYVPEEAITSAFLIDEEHLKRRAQRRTAKGDDLTAYATALDEVRTEMREYQAYLLLALAVKGTATAEDFLSDYLDSSERQLRASAAISLLFYGSQRAIWLLREEAAGLPEPHAERLSDLIELGISRCEQQEKIIDLEEATRSRPTRPTRSSGRESCTLCGRSKHDVDRLMSGNQVYLCNICISYIHQQRRDLVTSDQEEHICSFCTSTIFEVQHMHRVKELLLCDRCLDTCVGLLAREEVERFLRGFS